MKETPLFSVDNLRNWDFTHGHARLVASLSGTYGSESDILKFGHTRLAFLIRSIGCGVQPNGNLMRNRGDSNKYGWFTEVECQVCYLLLLLLIHKLIPFNQRDLRSVLTH